MEVKTLPDFIQMQQGQVGLSPVRVSMKTSAFISGGKSDPQNTWQSDKKLSRYNIMVWLMVLPCCTAATGQKDLCKGKTDICTPGQTKIAGTCGKYLRLFIFFSLLLYNVYHILAYYVFDTSRLFCLFLYVERGDWCRRHYLGPTAFIYNLACYMYLREKNTFEFEFEVCHRRSTL